MTNSELLKKQKEFFEVAENFIDKWDLDFGNGEFTGEDGGFILTIEAPYHTTLTVDFRYNMPNLEDYEKYEYEEIIINEAEAVISDFDDEEYFTDLWSRDFAEHNNFSPREFMKILEEDKEYFENIFK